LLFEVTKRQSADMKFRTAPLRTVAMLSVALLSFAENAHTANAQAAAAVSAFDLYIGKFESRLNQQHSSPTQFLASVNSGSVQSMGRAQPVLEELTPLGGMPLPGALLHDWRGAAFVRGATAKELEALLKDFDAYPRRFAPQVLRAKVIAQQGNHFEVSMRVSQRHVITVVMDSTYDVSFGQLDEQHGYSRSQSKAISEIDSPGTRHENALSPEQEHGFLWRLNTYWSWEERDGGLFMQIESVSLTRSIPVGLGWAVRPFVESVPRDSLRFTLQSVCSELQK
jgi:hypothetical protein